MRLLDVYAVGHFDYAFAGSCCAGDALKETIEHVQGFNVALVNGLEVRDVKVRLMF